MTQDTKAPERIWVYPIEEAWDYGGMEFAQSDEPNQVAYARADLLTTAEAERDRLAGLLEDVAQILSQCTWSTMRVNGQYVDRQELVGSYRATLAKLEKEKTDDQD